MGIIGGVISNLLSLGAKLLPAVIASAHAPSSSSSPTVDQNHKIEAELKKLMRMLERIEATLYDAEQREIRDKSVKLWLKELKGVAHDAEDVLGEYHYEVLRAQVEARDASPPDSRKRKLIEVPDSMLDQIQKIRSRFDEIEKDRIALQLSEGDGPRHCNNELQIAPTSHVVVQSDIFGRQREKEKLIDLLSSERDVVSVVTIVGMGGIGKTTIAQLAYNDQRIRQRFDKFGWICVSEDFNVERLTKESMESITGNKCDLTNLSALQEKIQKEISGKSILLVLDDVWNEKKSLWNAFQAPFMSATFAKILITTRNNHVARIMQTEPTLKLGYLPAEQCWQLFKHYAFDGVDQNKDPKLVEIGKQIMNKCGMLPLAVKSIASLLRYEEEEESWREILESELWESANVKNEIFPPLQISYTRLPTYLKSCFVYCSMFPKDYLYDVEYLVKLWIYQGFIESKGNKTAEKIGFEYAQQLCQRALFEGKERFCKGDDFIGLQFKLHDIVHDLARLNSKKGCYSIEGSELSNFPNVLHHLYIADSAVNLKDPIPSDKCTTLRTLITGSSVKNFFSTFDLSMAPKLRALEIWISRDCELELLSSIGNLKHLCYLSLCHLFFDMLPESICSLYSLQNLTLRGCHLAELPTKIGNLVSMEELIIDGCFNLMVLPESLCQLKALRKLFICSCFKIKELPNNIGNLVMLEELRTENCHSLQALPGSLCQLKALRKLCFIDCNLLEELPSDMGSLTNLQTLEISNTGISYLPPSLSKFVGIQTLKVKLNCETVGWLKDFSDLGGTLCLCGLKKKFNLLDVQCANLVSMHNLEHLILDWNGGYYWDIDGSVFKLITKSGQNIFLEDQSCLSMMEMMFSLQPPPNLSKLQIEGYGGITFPEWIGCLSKLKYLNITLCNSLQFLKGESLPLELEELKIYGCHQLVSMHGMQKLKSLFKLSIDNCPKLWSIKGPSSEPLEFNKVRIRSRSKRRSEESSVLTSSSFVPFCESPESNAVPVQELGPSIGHFQFNKARIRSRSKRRRSEESSVSTSSSFVPFCESPESNAVPVQELWFGYSFERSSFLGLTDLASLSSLKISNCFNLQVLDDELLPVESCKVEVSNCPGLRQWCLRHGVNYKLTRIEDDVLEEEDLSEAKDDEEDLFEIEGAEDDLSEPKGDEGTTITNGWSHMVQGIFHTTKRSISKCWSHMVQRIYHTTKKSITNCWSHMV